ncbi:MAG: P1 family peptidase, partial [Planctomycetaceae bacterium]
ATLNVGPDQRTGVTAIIPHADSVFQNKIPAALAVGNGFGKFIGATQIAELGHIETPIVLTNTLSTFAAADALVGYVLAQPGNDGVRSVNPVVGECNDGHLNDIRGRHITADHVVQALRTARGGPVAEGSIGAGTGTRCFGWKGGIGTSSRKIVTAEAAYTVGILTQTNFSGVLNIGGAPVGRVLKRHILSDQPSSADKGSCIVVLATDAPLDSRQLQRLARRALLGLAEVGSPMTHGSGDYAIAVSLHPDVRIKHHAKHDVIRVPRLRDDALTPLFQAAKEATAEAVINSLLRATTVTGYRGRVVEAIPVDEVIRICRKYHVIRDSISP